jgi:hypothetical protein
MRIARAWTAALAALALAPDHAEAQFRHGRGGFGLGFGFGFSPYYYSPGQPEPLLYRQAALNASRATMGPPTREVYAGSPAAYIYHLHEPGYLDGYDVATRRRIEAAIGRYSDGPPPEARRAWPRGPAAAAIAGAVTGAAAIPAPVVPRARPAPAEEVPPAPRDAAEKAGPGPRGPMR